MKYINIFKQAQQCITNIESEVLRLLPNGRREGNAWVALNPTRADNNLGSFRINLHTGKWYDFATGDGGRDLVSLVAYLKGVNQYIAAIDLVGGKSNILTLPHKISVVRSKPKKLFVETLISNILRRCQDAQSSVVEDYLKSRGYSATIPSSIRFHPRLYHAPSKSFYPAMVSVILRYSDGGSIGIHRTYLETRDNKVFKVDVIPNKMMLGDASGGAVMLASPEPGKPLVIAEGIETALSIYAATSIPTWAALSTSGMIKVVVPPLTITKQIIIAADCDQSGILAAKLLANRLLQEGYKVKIAAPSKANTDFNDLLLEKEEL